MTLSNDNWIIERLVVGELMVNCYIVGWRPTKEAVIFDPGGEVERILKQVGSMGLIITDIVNTHGHGDHIWGNGEIIEVTGKPLMIGRNDAEMLTDPFKNRSAYFGFSISSPPADRLLDEGDIVKVGEGELKVYHTPGHSPGSMIFVGDGFVIAGDLVFSGSIGRTDFPGGSMETLLKMVKEKLFPLGDEYVVLPGHGPETTVGDERKHNPFLQPGFNLDWI